MTNRTSALLLVVIALAGFNASTPRAVPIASTDLVGVWQLSPVMASGWTESFLFYGDGKFERRYSQMDCEKRLIAEHGKWSFHDPAGDTLKVIIRYKDILEGGFKVRSDGSCATDYMIEGGEIIIDTLDRSEGMLMKLRNLKFDEEFEKPSMLIGGRKFWKFSSEPDDYYR